MKNEKLEIDTKSHIANLLSGKDGMNQKPRQYNEWENPSEDETPKKQRNTVNKNKLNLLEEFDGMNRNYNHTNLGNVHFKTKVRIENFGRNTLNYRILHDQKTGEQEEDIQAQWGKPGERTGSGEEH